MKIGNLSKWSITRLSRNDNKRYLLMACWPDYRISDALAPGYRVRQFFHVFHGEKRRNATK